MTKDEKLRLCGGICFMLLLEDRKQRKRAKEYYRGETDGLSDTDVLFGLAHVMAPDWLDPMSSQLNTVRGNVSEFKACKSNGGTSLPFSDKAARLSFDNSVRNDYAFVLNRMVQFTDRFLDKKRSTKKDERLVKALVDLLAKDTSIDKKQLFYTSPDGVPQAKEDILQLSVIPFDAFLLGLWHFAVLRKEGNAIGSETFDKFCPPKGGAKRVYIGDLGEKLPSLSLTYSSAEDFRPDEEINETTDDGSQFVNDTDRDATEQSQEQKQEDASHPLMQVAFVQNGDHNIQIAHLDNLDLNRMWGEDNER